MFSPRTGKPRSWFIEEIGIPGCMLLFIVALECWFFDGYIVTPIFSLLALIILAFYLRPKPMIIWTFIYSTVSVLMLINPDFSLHGRFNFVFTTRMECATAIAGGFIAMLLCVFRARTQKGREQMLSLVKLIPQPFLISDEHAAVVFINDKAAGLLGAPGEMIMGGSLFSIFDFVAEKGTTIQRYAQSLDSETPRELVVEIKRRRKPGSTLRAAMLPVSGASGKFMLTMLSEPSPPPSEHSIAQ